MDKQRHSERRPLADRQQLAQELARLAAQGEMGNDAAERRAWSIISQCIEQQDDATLASGLVQTTEIEAHETLWQQINFFASTALLQERTTGAPLLIELFAIPVLFTNGEAFAAPTLIPRPGELMRMARRHRLLNHKNDRIFWFPELYTHDQLARLSWSGLYGITAAMSRQLLRPAGRLAIEGLPALSGPGETGPGTAHLRFIVGGAHFNPDHDDMPLSREESSDQYQTWCKAVADYLRLSPGMQVQLFQPALIPEALVQGQMRLRLQQLAVKLEEALVEADAEPAAVSVYISVHGESEAAVKEFRIAAYAWDDADEQVFAQVWQRAPHENPNEVARHFCDLLEAAGIVNVFFIDEVLPDDRCDCCGGPLFRGPLEGDDGLPGTHYPGSGMLH